MLEFVGTFGEERLDLHFVDEISPKEWRSEIESKLKEYKENAFIDDNRKLSLFIVLRLNPSDDEIDDIGYITGHINEFVNYYYNIIREIKASD